MLAAYAIERLRFVARTGSAARSFSPIWCRPRSCSFRSPRWSYQFGLFDTPIALILTYPTFLVPFCTWLLIGYFKSIPYELEECALIDGASGWQILPDHAAAGGARPDLGRHLRFTLSWNEFIYALAFISENKTVPVAILTELVTAMFTNGAR